MTTFMIGFLLELRFPLHREGSMRQMAEIIDLSQAKNFISLLSRYRATLLQDQTVCDQETNEPSCQTENIK